MSAGRPEPTRVPYLEHWVPAIVAEGVLSPDDCTRVLDMAAPDADAGIQGDGRFRDSRVAWIHPGAESQWLFDRLEGVIAKVNDENYRLELVGFTEPLQVAAYGPGQYYHWHLDLGHKRLSIRKLSFAVQLSDPADYEGGAFEIFCEKDARAMKQTQGAMILFPAYIVHRVSEVTRGTRHSLVGWVGGPHFR